MIDVHHHIVPQHAPKSLNLPKWSIEEDSEAMDRLGIKASLLSVPATGNAEMVLCINEHLASLVQYKSKNYGFLASLCLESIDNSTEQVHSAYNSFHADGFILPTNYNGLYLGSEKLIPVLDALNRNNAVVLIHPSKPSGDNFPSFDRDLSVYEYPLETTRAVMDMIFNNGCPNFQISNGLFHTLAALYPF